MIEMINEEEKKMFGYYIDSYAISDSIVRTASIDTLLTPWEENKSKYLNRIFSDSLILEKKITFTTPADELEEQIEKKLLGGNFPDPVDDFIDDYRHKVLSFYNDNLPADTIFRALDEDAANEGPFSYTAYYALRRIISARCLAANIWSGDPFEIYNPEDENKPIKVSRGARIIRLLNKIAKAYNLDGFESFRLKHSQILNQKALTGTMCVSIHPLDYATMSDNDYGWSSCMSWKEEGCYRQGTVEMMNSPMVVVAYLRGEVDMNMPGCNYWSNKKWRELFIITPEIITNVKGYPYRNEEFSKFVLTWLKELAEKAEIGTYCKEIVKYDTWKNCYLPEMDITTRVETSTNNMYNDFSNDQFGIFSNDEDNVNHTIELYYSGPSECMCCGETDVNFDSEGCLVGECCVEYWYCDCCECRYTSNETMHWIKDAYLCDYCYEENTDYDKITGEVYLTDDLTEISLGDPAKYSYPEKINIRLTSYNNKKYYAKYFKNIHVKYQDYMLTYFVDIEDCTEEGLKLFDYKTAEDVMRDYSIRDSYEEKSKYRIDYDIDSISTLIYPYHVDNCNTKAQYGIYFNLNLESSN